jgi:hypothetical protein
MDVELKPLPIPELYHEVHAQAENHVNIQYTNSSGLEITVVM